MSAEAYVLEDSPVGRAMVVTGPWSPRAADALRRGEADELVLNYARGFCDRDLDFIEEDWRLRRLQVLDRALADLEPISRLAQLEDLSVQAAPTAELDLSALPNLRSIAGEWGLVGPTLSTVEALESVVTWAFTETDLHAFRDHFGLRRLTIKDAPYLETLAGIEFLGELQVLGVIGALRLADIRAVSELGTLTELELEECPRLETLEDVESLVNLRFLGFNDSGELQTLAPLAGLRNLEHFHAWGSTRVVDGNLSPLTALPNLVEVRMRNRRTYRPPVAEIVDAAA